MDSKLYVYELVISKDEYKKLIGRRIMTDTEWTNVGEQLTDLLEATATKFIEDNRRNQ